MNWAMGVATYVVVWWLCFMACLPIGATSLAETGETAEPGVERAAPKNHRLAFKAGLAAVIAAVVWLGLAWAVVNDFFHMVPS